MKKIAFLGLCLGLVACDQAPSIQAQAAETYQSKKGKTYTIERFKVGPLPQNADLKMVDGDIVRYAQDKCGLDVYNDQALRCDVFVQNDQTGKLIGYAVLMQTATNTDLQTFINLNEQLAPGKSCGIQGSLYRYDDGKSEWVKLNNASGDFDTRIVYNAWNRGDGETLVAEEKPDSTEPSTSEGATGVWYIAKKGNKLRIQQERWNYCYDNRDVNIDEV